MFVSWFLVIIDLQGFENLEGLCFMVLGPCSQENGLNDSFVFGDGNSDAAIIIQRAGIINYYRPEMMNVHAVEALNIAFTFFFARIGEVIDMLQWRISAGKQ
jgi:hypothetical protein